MNKSQLKDLIREEVQSHLSEQQNENFVSDLEDIKSKFSRTANEAIDYIDHNNVDTKGELQKNIDQIAWEIESKMEKLIGITKKAKFVHNQ